MKQSIPQSRAYRHLMCESVTVIAEDSFTVISNPLSDMTRTWCTYCDSYFPLSDYEWVDTGENISQYCARHSASASQLQRFLCSKTFWIICAVTGFMSGSIGGFLLFQDDALWLKILMTPMCGLFGVFGGAAVHIDIITKFIVRKVCGVTDTRVLT